MIYVFSILSVLCLLDLFLLKVMPKFYFSIGIPIYNGVVEIKGNKTLKEIGAYVAASGDLVYKISNSKLIFRTKFTLLNLYTIGFLSIIKGDIKLFEGKAHIIQRVNLTTIYFFILMIFVCVTEKIDIIGYIILAVFILIAFVSHLTKIRQIKEVRGNIETHINREMIKS